MTQNEQNRRVKKLVGRFDEVNALYIMRLAERIAKIGQMKADEIDTLAILFAMNDEIAEINAQVSLEAQKAVPELYSLYQDDLNAAYTGQRFSKALKETPLSIEGKAELTQVIQDVSGATAEKMLDLSESTAVASSYHRAVDRAKLAVQGPLETRAQSIRQIVREIGYRGLQTEYDSGHRRRLSVALQENILNGLKELRQRASDYLSDVLQFDAREISAHPNSAPDHEPIQGRVFMLSEYQKLQNHEPCVDIDGRHYPAQVRAIGELNCRHVAYGFSTEHSERRYSNQELDDMSQANANGCQIDGQYYSLYEARQYVRKLEAELERQEDVLLAADAANDNELKREANTKIKELKEQIARASKEQL